ncbi:MAG: T9SS type A sorting domain-containing protein [Ignavibacteriaceae bacterium]|nr:T9SS type A sorting domain-containing protein [Ignavibacteriaceae bacterium]
MRKKLAPPVLELRLVISKYNSTINKWEVVNNQVLKSSHVLSWEIDGNPVIGWGSGSKAMVMWEHWYGPLYMDDYLGYKYLMINYYNGAITDYTNSSDGVWVVPTDLNYIPVSPAIHANKASPEYYALAWQENTSATASRICSYNILPGSGNEVNFSNYRIPSAGKGYALNYSPSIISVNGASSRLTWAGKRSVYIDEKDLGDNPSEEQFEIRTLFADPDNTSQGWAFGNDIHSPTITSSINTSTNTVSAYVIVWSENEGASVKCINSTLNQANIKTMGITGKDVQVNNGFGTGSGSLSGTNSMYGKSFQNSTVPYSFAQSASIQSLGLNKEQSIAIGSAREGVVWKDSVEFYFSIGDIERDGEQVDFIEIPDTAQFSSLANFNAYLLSEPFTINNTSLFQYSVLYGVSDSVTASAVLSTDGYVKYKVELFENQTGQILGTFDAVTFNQFSAGNYNNISYSVNTEGIGNKTVRLRLVMEDNISASYTVTQKYSERNDLLKGKDAKLTLNQTMTVTEYSLSPNYPNPFNPVTEIEFALPEQSDISLKVFDILGKEVATLASGSYLAGRYTVPFDGTSHASGVYIYKLSYGKGQSITRKMTLLK